MHDMIICCLFCRCSKCILVTEDGKRRAKEQLEELRRGSSFLLIFASTPLVSLGAGRGKWPILAFSHTGTANLQSENKKPTNSLV
jgi:hypothetical protein